MSRAPTRWTPTMPDGVANPFDEVRPIASDWYLVIDDIDGPWIHLVASHWPQVDSSGALAFPDVVEEAGGSATIPDPSDLEIPVPAETFRRFVSDQRRRRDQPAPERALRVGDVFWYRGDLPQPGATRLDGEAADVTFAARREAKAAMAWASAGTPRTGGMRHGRRRTVPDERPQPDAVTDDRGGEPTRPSLPGSVAGPAV